MRRAEVETNGMPSSECFSASTGSFLHFNDVFAPNVTRVRYTNILTGPFSGDFLLFRNNWKRYIPPTVDVTATVGSPL